MGFIYVTLKINHMVKKLFQWSGQLIQFLEVDVSLDFLVFLDIQIIISGNDSSIVEVIATIFISPSKDFKNLECNESSKNKVIK